MLERPRLKTYLTVFPISETTWGLRGGSDELWRVRLGNERAMRVFGLLLPYLAGRHTHKEILDALEKEGIDHDVTEAILEHLERSSLLEEADPWGLEPSVVEHFRDQIAFFSRFTHRGGGQYQARLLDSHVAVVGGGHFAACLRRQLAKAGFGALTALGPHPRQLKPPTTARSGPRITFEALLLDRENLWPGEEEPPDLLFVPQESHDPSLLEVVETWSKKRGVPWMLLRALDFHEGWVGPLFVPGETADYRSFDARLAGNLAFYTEHRAFDESVRTHGESPASLGGLFAFFDQLASVAVIEAIKWISGIRTPTLAGRLLSVNPWSWEVRSHDVLQVPGLGEPDTTRPAACPWKEVLYAGNDR